MYGGYGTYRSVRNVGTVRLGEENLVRIAITGSSGLIGTALRDRLTSEGHQVVPMVRRTPAAGEIEWDPAAGRLNPEDLVGVDAVVNLAGAGVGDKRWNPERKRVVLESRTKSTALLAGALAAVDGGPRTLLSGSAIGFYGDRGDDVVTEDDPPGNDFLAQLCVQWEASAQPAVDAGIRTAFLRSGTVQDPDGGALGKLMLPFKLGLGGRIGSGRQWWSWISIDDEVRAITHLLTSDRSGPFNLTAPEPVTVNEYVKALGRQLHRPTVLPTPSFAPRLLLGKELADTLLNTSQRIVPRALADDGFQFRHPTIESCFAALLGPQEIT